MRLVKRRLALNLFLKTKPHHSVGNRAFTRTWNALAILNSNFRLGTLSRGEGFLCLWGQTGLTSLLMALQGHEKNCSGFGRDAETGD
jgi:hypothetical protein